MSYFVSISGRFVSTGVRSLRSFHDSDWAARGLGRHLGAAGKCKAKAKEWRKNPRILSRVGFSHSFSTFSSNNFIMSNFSFQIW